MTKHSSGKKYYIRNKSLISYPSSKVTTVKNVLCFFSRKWFMIHLHVSLSSVTSLSLLQIHKWDHALHTVPLLWIGFEDVFVSPLVALCPVCNNSCLELHCMAAPWFTDSSSCRGCFGFKMFATNVSWCTCISTSDKFLVVAFLD